MPPTRLNGPKQLFDRLEYVLQQIQPLKHSKVNQPLRSVAKKRLNPLPSILKRIKATFSLMFQVTLALRGSGRDGRRRPMYYSKFSP